MIITPRILTVNFHAGRISPYPTDVIVDHVTEGSAASVRDWFSTPRASPTSAHYMVTTAGTVDQFVREEDTAYHAGIVDRPTAAIVIERGAANPNGYAIGIEHEGDGTRPLVGKQLDASLALHLDIIQRRGIPVNRRHIIGHHEIRRSKSCPGAISVDNLVALLVREINPPAPVPVPDVLPPSPVVVWSAYLTDWLVAIEVRSDTDWTFVRLRDLRAGAAVPMRSTTSLRAMPRGAR